MREFLKQLFFAAEDLIDEGNFALGIKAYQAALHEAKKDDFEEFLALSFLGMAYDDNNKLKMALDNFEKARDLAAKLYGPESQVYAVAINNLAMLSSNRGRVEAAEPLLDQAIGILQSTNTKVPPELRDFVRTNVVEVFANASDCKAKLGHVELAVDLMRQCHALAKSNLHPGSRRRLQAAVELGAMLASTGQLKEVTSVKNEILRDLTGAGLSLSDAVNALDQAVMHARSMLQSFDDFSARAKPRTKKMNTKTMVSNVVPFTRV
jgi:tetratricopeptide (TPR) repeat protein